MKNTASKYATRMRHLRDFVIYFGVACAGLGTNLGSGIVIGILTPNFNVRLILSYLCGMVVSFTLSKLMAFDAKQSGNTRREALKFFGVSMLALITTVIGGNVALQLIDNYFAAHPQQLIDLLDSLPKIKSLNRNFTANVFGIGCGFFINFFGHKLITFRTTGYWDKISKALNIDQDEDQDIDEDIDESLDPTFTKNDRIV